MRLQPSAVLSLSIEAPSAQIDQSPIRTLRQSRNGQLFSNIGPQKLFWGIRSESEGRVPQPPPGTLRRIGSGNRPTRRRRLAQGGFRVLRAIHRLNWLQPCGPHGPKHFTKSNGKRPNGHSWGEFVCLLKYKTSPIADVNSSSQSAGEGELRKRKEAKE